MATVELNEVAKVYPNGVEAVRGLTLAVGQGELMVLVGPSGCGKTTVLRMVAGLEEISSGEIRIGGRVVNDLPPKGRDIAMVFQNYALYPHMTVAENIGFSLKLGKVPKSQIEAKVRTAASMLGLSEWLDRKPGQLSGGQRQRVAMGRAIVREPKVFLMDEPLSNLDAKLRVQMRAEVSRLQRQLGVATLYVTHDQTEAMTMGDRVAVLLGGVLQQCATPQELYDRPLNLFVAGFIGSPAMNLYEGQITPDGACLRVGSQQVALPKEVWSQRPALGPYRGKSVVAGIRPEHLPAAGLADGARLDGHVELVEALGSELLVHFTIDARSVQASGGADSAAPAGAMADWTGSAVAGWSVARVDPGTKVRVGDLTSFRIRPSDFHFFDPRSGVGIWADSHESALPRQE